MSSPEEIAIPSVLEKGPQSPLYRPRQGNIFKTAWNLLNNVYDGYRDKPMKIVRSSRSRSEQRVEEDTDSFQESHMKFLCEISKTYSRENVPVKRDNSHHGRPVVITTPTNLSPKTTKSDISVQVYKLDSNNNLVQAPHATEKKSCAGINSILDEAGLSSRSSHRTDINVNTRKGGSQSQLCAKFSSAARNNPKQYIRLSEIFQSQRNSSQGPRYVLSRTFLESVNEQIRQIKLSSDESIKPQTPVSSAISSDSHIEICKKASIADSSASQNPFVNPMGGNNVNINLTVSLAQVQGSTGTTVEIGKPTTVRINLPSQKTESTPKVNEPSLKYPSSWTTTSTNNLENTIITNGDTPLEASQAFEMSNINDALDSTTSIPLNDWTMPPSQMSMNPEGDSSTWSNYFSISNALSYTGESIKKAYEVAGGILTNYIIPSDPNVLTEEEMNDGENKVAISVMRLMGIPQQTRHSIYQEALQEVQVLHDVSAGTVDFLHNIVNWLCTGDLTTKESLVAKTRILAAMQSEVDADSEVWQQLEKDISLFTETVVNIVKGSFGATGAQSTIKEESGSEEDEYTKMNVDENICLHKLSSDNFNDMKNMTDESAAPEDDQSQAIPNSLNGNVYYPNGQDTIRSDSYNQSSNPFVDNNGNAINYCGTQPELNYGYSGEHNYAQNYMYPDSSSAGVVLQNFGERTDQDFDAPGQSEYSVKNNYISDIAGTGNNLNPFVYPNNDTLFNAAAAPSFGLFNMDFSQVSAVKGNYAPDQENIMHDSDHEIFYEAEDTLYENADDKTIMADENSHSLQINENVSSQTPIRTQSLKVCSPKTLSTFGKENIGPAVSLSANDTLLKNQITTETETSPVLDISEEQVVALESVVIIPKEQESIDNIETLSSKDKSDDIVVSLIDLHTDEIPVEYEKEVIGDNEGTKFDERALNVDRPDGNFSMEEAIDLNVDSNTVGEFELISEIPNTGSVATSRTWFETAQNESKLQTEMIALEEVAQVLYTNLNPNRATGSATSTYCYGSDYEEAHGRECRTATRMKRKSRIPLRMTNTNNKALESKTCKAQKKDKPKVSKIPFKKPVVIPKTEIAQEIFPENCDSAVSMRPANVQRTSCTSFGQYPSFTNYTASETENVNRKSDVFIKKSVLDSAKILTKSKVHVTAQKSSQAQPLKARPLPSFHLEATMQKHSHSKFNLAHKVSNPNPKIAVFTNSAQNSVNSENIHFSEKAIRKSSLSSVQLTDRTSYRDLATNFSISRANITSRPSSPVYSYAIDKRPSNPVYSKNSKTTLNSRPSSPVNNTSKTAVNNRHPHTSYRELLHTKKQFQTSIPQQTTFNSKKEDCKKK